MVCLGFKPGAAGWLAKTKPQSYGGHQLAKVGQSLENYEFLQKNLIE